VGYLVCQKAAVVKWTPQDSHSPSAHIRHRVLLLAFVSVAHFGHFAKIWVILMFLLIQLFKEILNRMVDKGRLANSILFDN